MQFLVGVIKKIFDGFLYGIGISVILVGTVYLVENIFTDPDVYGDYGMLAECTSYEDCSDEAGLTLTITGENIDAENFILLGNVNNTSDIDWSSVKVKAELFDSDNNFIDECSETLDRKVFSGEKVNFKLACSSCSRVDLTNYSYYKAEIIDARNW